VTTIEHDTVRTLLVQRAQDHPDAPLLRIDGGELSCREVLDGVERVAAGLRVLGGRPGDRVAVMADNCREAVWAWLGANASSLMDVPLNTALQGKALEVPLASARPRVVIGTVDYLARIAAAGAEPPEVAVSIGGSPGADLFPRATRQLTFHELLSLGRDASTERPHRPSASATATLLYTSGTTGPSKGVMIPQRYYSVWGRRGREYLQVAPGEVVYCAQPLFHVDARAYLLASLVSGATLALGTRFSASSFWDEVRVHGANVFSYIGTMLWLLYKRPESDLDRQHAVRVAGGAATPAEIHRQFEERFGIELREAYGMTESLFLAHADATTPPGSVGRPVPEIDGELLDDLDQPVVGTGTGEFCFRPREPFSTSQGYWDMPQETVDATRNLWFHTGDLLRRDEAGNLYFVGRVKDSIRRRGENISAWEVEQAAMQHPDVLQAAAIGVPSPLGEEDVALLVRLREGAALAPADLHASLTAELPRYALPRYVEVVQHLPTTPSERVDKARVRAAGISAAAWDAEAPAGEG